MRPFSHLNSNYVKVLRLHAQFQKLADPLNRIPPALPSPQDHAQNELSGLEIPSPAAPDLGPTARRLAERRGLAVLDAGDDDPNSDLAGQRFRQLIAELEAEGEAAPVA